MGPLDLLALQKGVDGLQGDVVNLLERFDALNSQSEERFNLVLKGSEATLDRLEKLEASVGNPGAFVDINRRLDLIEANVIDRAEETHKRITALLNSAADHNVDLENQIQVLTDRAAACNSQWGVLYDRVTLQGLAMDELGVVAVNLLEASKALQKRIDDLESSNLIAVEVAERHGDSIVLLEKLRRRDAGL